MELLNISDIEIEILKVKMMRGKEKGDERVKVSDMEGQNKRVINVLKHTAVHYHAQRPRKENSSCTPTVLACSFHWCFY